MVEAEFRWSGGGGAGLGGAIYGYNSELRLEGVTFTHNAARGGILPDPCCVWAVNWAGDASGGAIYNRGVLEIVNSTVAENRAKGAARVEPFGYAGWSTGGALANEGKAALRNVTWAGNSASLASGPGSPEVQGDTLAVVGGSVTLINTILQGAPGQTNVWGSVIDGGHNLSSDASAKFTTATSRAGADPLLGPLTDNGGATPTMALLPGSPAIDAGDDAAAPPGDQRGVGRPVGPHADIGAFEVGLSGAPVIISGPENTCCP